jgi:antitoxin component YwqK of YwqJK toxin-antitoxin module
MNQLNDNNERHGYWESYYPSGNLYYKGNYSNGEQIGYWIIVNKTFFYL